MLLELDVDCLDMICDHLKFKELVILSLVCMDLRSIIYNRFRRSCKKISFFSDFWLKKENAIYMPRILRLTKGILKEVKIRDDLFVTNKNWLQEVMCEKVTVLDISLRTTHSAALDRIENLKLVSKSFPNVEFIRIGGKFQRIRISIFGDIFPNMCKMDLYARDLGYFETSFGHEVAKIKNLQALRVSANSKSFRFDSLADAPKLSSITCLGRFKIWQYYYLSYVTNLQELTITHKNFEHMNIMGVYPLMKNLRKLTAYGSSLQTLNIEQKYFHRQLEGISIIRNFKDMNLFVDASKLRRMWCKQVWYLQLDLCNKAFQSLEEFYYINCGAIEERQQNVLNVVRRSPKLRLLDISGTKFDIRFIENLLEVLKGRKCSTSALHLRCYGTKITREELRCMNLLKYLEVSFEKFEYDLPTQRGTSFQVYLGDEPPDNNLGDELPDNN